jgi:YegS/Rv2252/BmrU family lipid kinase
LNIGKYLLIINPVSGRGRTGRLIPHIRSLLKEKGVLYELRITSRPGEATELARMAASGGFTCIVAVGGDGTAHEVINGLVGHDSAFGMIPTGGGNDFPKAAGIPLEIPKAVQTLIQGRRRRVDLGLIGDSYFINGLGIGLDGAVSHRYRDMKRLRGELGYLWGAVQEALRFKGFQVEIRIPDWSYRGTVLLTGASNGPCQGGDFKIAPDAKVDDGLLDIHIIRDMSPLSRLIRIPKVRKGNHLGLKEVEIRRAPWMEVSLDSRLPAHLDGEPFHLEPGKHRIEIVPRALEVISSIGE